MKFLFDIYPSRFTKPRLA